MSNKSKGQNAAFLLARLVKGGHKSCPHLLLRVFFLSFFALLTACGGKKVDVDGGGSAPIICAELPSAAYLADMKVKDETEDWPALEAASSRFASCGNLDEDNLALVKYYYAHARLEGDKGRDVLKNAGAALRLKPAELKYKTLFCLAQFRYGNRIKAESTLMSLYNSNSTSLEVVLSIARANEFDYNWQSAVAWYDRALKLSNTNKIHVKKGLDLWHLGFADEAVAELEQAVALDSSDARSLNDIGVISLAMGKEEKALDYFNKSIAVSSYYADALLNRANFYMSKKEYTKAIADCDAGLSQNKNNEKLLVAKGQAERDSGNIDGAAKSFALAYAQAPQNTDVLNEYAWFLSTCKKPEMRNGAKAVELAKKSAAVPVPEPGVYDTLAAAYAEAGLFKEATAAEETALELARRGDLALSTTHLWQKRLNLYKSGRAYYE